MELIRSFFLLIRSAISLLPDLFVSAVIPEEEEPRPEERNEEDDLEVYRCPVFMNRVSFDVFSLVGPVRVWGPSFRFYLLVLRLVSKVLHGDEKRRYNFPIPDIDVSSLSASPECVCFKIVAQLVKMLRKLADVNTFFTVRLVEYSVKL